MHSTRFLAAAAAIAIACPAFGAFEITLNFIGGMTAGQQAAFYDAKAVWENHIVDYKAGVTGISGITIDAQITPIDGVGGTLGQAGPTEGTSKTAANSVEYVYATNGIMQFDSADVAGLESSGAFSAVILHEMGHVLGFGTLWTHNNLYINGTGQYTGADALAAYRIEFNQPMATYVPVELDGGAGTANGHWDELNMGSGPTGYTDLYGRDMQRELMTGWLNTPTWISNTTIASFSDIGYAIPEPGVIGLGLIVGLCALSRRARRRRA